MTRLRARGWDQPSRSLARRFIHYGGAAVSIVVGFTSTRAQNLQPYQFTVPFSSAGSNAKTGEFVEVYGFGMTLRGAPNDDDITDLMSTFRATTTINGVRAEVSLLHPGSRHGYVLNLTSAQDPDVGLIRFRQIGSVWQVTIEYYGPTAPAQKTVLPISVSSEYPVRVEIDWNDSAAVLFRVQSMQPQITPQVQHQIRMAAVPRRMQIFLVGRGEVFWRVSLGYTPPP
jgi:hypothetical protein